MGTFSVEIQIGNQETREFLQLECLVDTGATYTLLPSDMLNSLGIKSVDQREFELADQRSVRHDVGEARLRVSESELTVSVVFAPEGAPPLIGATALEIFSMVADPVNQCLIPVSALLKSQLLLCAKHDR